MSGLLRRNYNVARPYSLLIYIATPLLYIGFFGTISHILINKT